MSDYYQTLGIQENATQDEIKAAYRRLAKQWHPDLNKGDSTAETKFKQINEANDILSDATKRAEYDQRRKFGDNPFGQHHGAHGQGFPGGFHFDFGHGSPFDDMLNQFFGQAFRGQPARNRDYQFTLSITLEDAFAGKNMPINFEVQGQSKNLVVNIPAGVQHGTKLRYQGHGDRSHANLPPGDLYVMINILEHPLYRRDGPHLHSSMSIDALSAMVGTTREITAIDGTNLSINIPQGSQHGHSLRVSGRGMPMHNNARQRGDLLIQINIVIPRDISSDHMTTIRDILTQRNEGRK